MITNVKVESTAANCEPNQRQIFLVSKLVLVLELEMTVGESCMKMKT